MKEFFSFLSLFCAVWSMVGQQLSDCKKWDYLIDEQAPLNDKNPASKYFLVHLHSTDTFAGKKVIRRLDPNHQIVFSESAQPGFVPTTNIWKLSNNVVLDSRATEIFVLKTNGSTRALGNTLRTNEAEIIKQRNGLLVVKTNIEIIKNVVLNNSEVVYVGREQMKTKQESVVNDLNPTVNGINSLKKTFPDLKGSGRTVGVKDNQYFADDIDLIGKNVDSPIISEIVDSHATDMSTIIGGLGNSSATSLGVSSESTIFLSDFNEVFPDSQMILDNAQVRIQNHSYGTDIENIYGELAFEYDVLVNQNPEMLHVFSSGNSGTETSDTGMYSGISGFANITGNFKMSKNTLLVGAMNELNQATSFSSKGPAYDGRIKPELVAYSFEGTSNTAALVSGAANLVQEAYENELGEMPKAALLKALLINSADDIGIKGPDFSSGFGSLNAKGAVDLVMSRRFINDVVSTNQTKNFVISVPENANNLKMTLVWTDPAANANDNIALINDLDLKLISPTNEEILPWVLNTTADLNTLQNPATRGIDSLNNVEQIGLEMVSSGDYTIRITGNDLVDDQTFSIVYSWEEANQFSWTYPLENENYPFNGEFIYALRWGHSFSDSTRGSLSVQYNESGEWESLDENVAVASGFYQWTPPEEFNGTARLRMSIGTSEFLSSVFTITKLFNVQVPLNCETVVELNWPKIEAVDEYRIYNLQGRQMEVVGQVRDTLFTFEKTDFATSYFAVAPILNDTNEGIRSPTVNYQNFDENCYFNTVSAELSEDQPAIIISSRLSSLSNIESISVINIGADGTERLIETLSSLTNATISIQDENPTLGQNNYQLRINTITGSTINSAVVSAFFFTEDEPYLLFPNPILDKGVNLYSNKEEEEIIIFELYDLKGRLLFQQEIRSDRDFINMQGLQSGIYLYSIESSTRNYKSGKLLVNN